MAISAERSHLPQVSRWNAAIAEKGFDLKLDDFDWSSHSGFLPAQLLGASTGFELSLEDTYATVYLGGSQFAFAAASVALAVLQDLTGGTYTDDDGQELGQAEFEQQARLSYYQCRILKARLDASHATAWDEPVLMPGESRDDRLSALEQLTQVRLLVKESDGATYRLHKLRAEDLRKELAGPQDA